MASRPKTTKSLGSARRKIGHVASGQAGENETAQDRDDAAYVRARREARRMEAPPKTTLQDLAKRYGIKLPRE